MQLPTNTDIELHALSLQIAAIYHRLSSANTDGIFKVPMDDLLIAYRNVRRCITKDENGKRHGANYAHHVMSQGTL